MGKKVKTKTFDRYVRDLEKEVFPEFEKEDIMKRL